MIHINLKDKSVNSISILELHKQFITDENERLYIDLNNLKDSSTNLKVKSLVQFILKNLNNIAVGDVQQLNNIKEEFLKRVYREFKATSQTDCNEFKRFHKSVHDLFGKAYDTFCGVENFVTMGGQEIPWHAYKYVECLNLSICPYCHAQYINSIRNNMKLIGAGKQARAALDHFVPKFIFPIFSVSLYNLVPACTYCNSFFKSEYYSTFENCYSPFEAGIENNFKFEITPVENSKNAFMMLKNLSEPKKSEIEQNYLLLIERENKESLENIEKLLNDIQKTIQMQNSLSGNVRSKEVDKEEKLKKLVEDIKNVQAEWIQTVNEYLNDTNLINEYFLEALENQFKEYSMKYNEFKSFPKRSGFGEFKKNLTSIRNDMDDVTKYIFALNFRIMDEAESKDFNFVDVNLGLSNEFKINIIPDNNCDENLKRKVLSNVALFQLDEVYKEFNPYVKEKYKQLHLLNKVYLQSLINNFPMLMNEDDLKKFNNTLFYTKESYRDQILGKMIYDIFNFNDFSKGN